jgi:8-oxo-dGTP pyrophosphatase MutT (NUDIX family)
VVELTGIGGGLQPSDHSLTDAARREAREEVYSDVRLLPCKGTLWVRGPDQVEKIACAGGERPAAIVFRHHRTPPHQPWHAQHRGETCLVVFLDELLSCPHPTPEVPLLTWLDPETLCAIARTDLPFEALPGRFALLSPRACPPEGTLVRLTDSQESLVLALGIEAEPFYRGIAERYS